jgi:hypothetical protein
MGMSEETDADAARWVEQSKRETLERRAKKFETPWARREPEQVLTHVRFALALAALSGDRTKRFLEWFKSQSGWHHAGGGSGGG